MEAFGLNMILRDLTLRIRKILENNSKRFLDRVFAREELDICMVRKDPVPGLSARFAAKEAFSKSFSLGWGSGVSWSDVAVVNDKNGKPEFLLRNKAVQIAAGKKLWLSISHTDNYAVATVIVEEV